MKKMSGRNICPICGTDVPEDDICHNCGWQNDPNQRCNPNLRGANQMTLNEAKKAYKEGKLII